MGVGILGLQGEGRGVVGWGEHLVQRYRMWGVYVWYGCEACV